MNSSSSGQSTPRRRPDEGSPTQQQQQQYSNQLLRLDSLNLLTLNLQNQLDQQSNNNSSITPTANNNNNNRGNNNSNDDTPPSTSAGRLPSNYNQKYEQINSITPPFDQPLTHYHSQQPPQQEEERYNPGSFPPEIIALIIQHLYFSIIPLPQDFPSPDPHLALLPSPSPSLPSYSNKPSFAPTPAEEARITFTRLALVDRTWGLAATNYLWKSVGFGIPRAFESVLRTIEEYSTGRRITRAERVDISGSSGWSFDSIAGMSSNNISPVQGNEERGRLENWGADSKWSSMGGPFEGDNINNTNNNSGFTLINEPTLESLKQSSTLNELDSPLLRTKYISFSRFRTAGLRRSVRQGSHERFVTPYRLLALFRGTRIGDGPLIFPGAGEDEEDSIYNLSEEGEEEEDEEMEFTRLSKGKLEAVGFTEFMDSAISKNVLDELLFRGGYLAEYEEPEEIIHLMDSTTTTTSIPPSPAFNNALALPSITTPLGMGMGRSRANSGESFSAARHLQSSNSRSPNRSAHLPTLAPNFEEENSDGDEDDEMTGGGGDNERGRTGRLELPHTSFSTSTNTPHMLRRDSGSAFAPPSLDLSGSIEREESEERGRDRTGREPPRSATSGGGLVAPGTGGGGGGGRGRGQRRSTSLVPPSAFLSRSSSVPAHYLHRSTSFDTERSSSVPASVRRSRGIKKMVINRVLEGSTQVRAIRALDLCGCVSSAFVASLEVMIRGYKLGPPGLYQYSTSGNSISAISESEDDTDEDDTGTEGGFSNYGSTMSGSNSYSNGNIRGGGGGEGGSERKLRRIFFPHLRRLGLASSLLPSPLLTCFVLSFPYLTHLDLTFTLASPQLLKNLAVAGQKGPGGRSMRLKSLSLARCRLLTGASIVGLMCGDCPPFTSMASTSTSMGGGGGGYRQEEESEEESWGSGEVVSSLIDLSLYGDSTHPSPLSPAEFRLVLTISPAFTSGCLRTLDLASTPINDLFLLEHFPLQPHLIELGLANCRNITLRAVAAFLIEKCPGVEILDLSNSCPPLIPVPANRRPSGIPSTTISIMELHTQLLSRVASVNNSSFNTEEAELLLVLRETNLRVVELDSKALEAVQGGAGDWKPIWGKGRRGWYVDTSVTSIPNPDPSYSSHRPRKLQHLPRGSERRRALERLSQLNGVVSGDLGWHSRKMEVLRGDGMSGKEDGLYAFHSYQT